MVPQRKQPETVLRLLALLIGLAGGIVVFVNYYWPLQFVDALAEPLLKWVVVLTAAALLYASLHLAIKHAGRIRQHPLSAVVVVGFVLMFIAGLLPSGFSSGLGLWLYLWLLAPGLAALFALLPIFLAYALYKHLRLRDLGVVLFLISLLLVLLGQTPVVLQYAPVFATIRHNLLVGLTAPVFRGVLIGLALGVILAALSRLRVRL